MKKQPKHLILKRLLKELDYPLAAPSANISTRLSAVNASHVKEEFGSKIKYILDGGKCAIGLESTIISLINKPTILRVGGMDISTLKKILGKKIFFNINPKKIFAPGQSPVHYSPGIPLKINSIEPEKDGAFLSIKKKKKLKNYFYLSLNNDLNEAAKNLYTCLRIIKNKGYKSIAVEKIPYKGLGRAINDRLHRAAKFKTLKS